MKLFAARLARAAVMGVLTVGIVLAVAHVPAVRARVVTWGLERLRTSLLIDVKVDQASYNLLRLSGRLRGVTASVLDGTGVPFVVADEVSVDLSWSALLGRVGAEVVEVSGLKITVVRASDGSLNLPVFPSAGGASASRVRIGRLLVRDASVSYQDLGRNWSVGVEGLALNLEPTDRGTISGRLTAARGPSIQAGAVESRGTRLAGLVSYDGASVSVDRLQYDAPEGRLEIHGRLESLWSAPSSDFDISGSLALSQVSSTLKLDPPVRGTVTLQATVTGRLTEPLASIALDSDGISWRHVGPVSLRARSTVSASAVNLDAATARLDSGTFNGRGRFAFERGEAEVHADWQSVPAPSLLGPAAPFPAAARLTGTADLTWNGMDGWSGLRVTADNRSLPASIGREGVTVNGEASLVLDRGEWRLHHEHSIAGAVRVAGSSVGRLSAAALGLSRLGGTVVVSADDLSRMVPLASALGLTVPESIRPGAGHLDARLRLGGTFASPTLAGEAVVDAASFADVGPIEVESSIALDTRRMSVDRLRASLGTNRVTGSGTLDFTNRTLRATAGVELPDLGALVGEVAEPWRPTGMLSGSFDLGGVATRPVIRGTVTGARLAIASQNIDSLSAGIEYENGVFAARGLEIRQPAGGRLALDARYALETGAYTLTASATALSVQPVDRRADRWPVSAVLAGEFHGSGTVEHPRGDGHVTFATLIWDGVALGPADVGITVSDTGASLEARLGELSSTIAATAQIRPPRSFTVVAEAQDADLARLVRDIARSTPSVAAALEGRLSARLAATGVLEDLAAASVDVDLRQVTLRAGDAQLQLVQPVMLRYADRSLAIGQFQLRQVPASSRPPDSWNRRDRCGRSTRQWAGSLVTSGPGCRCSASARASRLMALSRRASLPVAHWNGRCWLVAFWSRRARWAPRDIPPWPVWRSGQS
jgi:hypothetical protein